MVLLMRLMIIGFGDENAIAIRLPSFLSGLASLWLIYKIAEKISESKSIAHSATFLGAVCPAHVYYSQTARGYGLMIFLSAATINRASKILAVEFIVIDIDILSRGILSSSTLVSASLITLSDIFIT